MGIAEMLDISNDWLEAQPEPTSDCDEIDHYAALRTMGQCPSCLQEEVRSK
jgi:hypothetical protein